MNTIINLQLHPGEAVLGRHLRRNLPAKIRLIHNELPEMLDQFAFVADIRLFTGISRIYTSVRNAILSNESTMRLFQKLVLLGIIL